ncbi:MAG: hypothetical protein ABIN57_08720 [Chitinophagaceae bacterium]
MKNFFFFLLSIILLTSCSVKEVQQKTAEDLVVQIMVSGQWSVVNYTKGSMDLTSEFDPYKFQFQKNRTVDALKNAVIEKSGTWDADANARTITSNFINANQTLSLLNGTWTITNTTLTSVDANQTVGGELRILKLKK